MRRIVAASFGVIVGGIPIGIVALAVGEVVPRLRRRRREEPDGIDVAARLLVMIGSGLPVMSALERVAGSVADIQPVARRARRLGTAAALASTTGPLAPLLRRLADAAASGAAPEPALRAYIETERRRRLTEVVERARAMPVKLMVPMALLVLPGFVLMVYGPTFLDLIDSLLGPLVG